MYEWVYHIILTCTVLMHYTHNTDWKFNHIAYSITTNTYTPNKQMLYYVQGRVKGHLFNSLNTPTDSQ